MESRSMEPGSTESEPVESKPIEPRRTALERGRPAQPDDAPEGGRASAADAGRDEGPGERDADEERARRLAAAKARAAEEADARRRTSVPGARPPEIDGRGGEEPTRYGDWEVKGLASDFS